MTRFDRRLVLILLAGTMSCDKGSTAGSAAPSDAAPASEADPASEPATAEAAAPAEETADKVEPGAPGVPWAEKTFKQRQEYMGITFFPAAKKSFKAYDEAAFAQFKCQTCHGDDMKERNYKMPSDAIYALNPENPVQDGMDFDAKVTQFMIDIVVPESAKLLDMEPFNPETGQGFGCFGCHPKSS